MRIKNFNQFKINEDNKYRKFPRVNEDFDETNLEEDDLDLEDDIESEGEDDFKNRFTKKIARARDVDDDDLESDEDDVNDEDNFSRFEDEDDIDNTDDEEEIIEPQDGYIGNTIIEDLANKLGVESVNNEIDYNGKKINFYSETEMIHVKDGGEEKRFKVKFGDEYKISKGLIDYIKNDGDGDFEIDEDEDVDNQDFKSIFNELKSMDKIDALSLLHEKLYDFINKKQFDSLREFMELFNNESVDVNYIKTILVVTKGIKNNQIIKDVRESLVILLDKKLESSDMDVEDEVVENKKYKFLKRFK